VIGFRVLFFLVPKTDGDRFRSGYGVDEYDFVLEAVLFSKDGENLVLDCLGTPEVRNFDVANSTLQKRPALVAA
jgi:hypothetical protein